MKVFATIKNSLNSNELVVTTKDKSKVISVPVKTSGYGSAVSGGELLLASLAVCYTNDIYREAAKRNITVSEVTVEVSGNFDSEGEAGNNFEYKPVIKSTASPAELRELIVYTDQVAEVHKTLRLGVSVSLVQ